ncbi:GntR family transcriptional regulator [Chloroflexota bacterium]
MTVESSELQPLTVTSLRDHIDRQLRSAILNGVFKQGERLVESGIAARLGVSRAPVREALSALEREGFVVSVPRRGYSVVEFTERDIDEIYSLRLLLETGALRRAMDRFKEQDFAELQRIVDQLGEAARQQSEPTKTVALDRAFHGYIVRKADHGRLYSAFESIRLQTQLLIGVTSRTHYDNPEQPRELHQRILDAIRSRDVEKSVVSLTEHIMEAQHRAYAALRERRSSEQEQTARGA